MAAAAGRAWPTWSSWLVPTPPPGQRARPYGLLTRALRGEGRSWWTTHGDAASWWGRTRHRSCAADVVAGGHLGPPQAQARCSATPAAAVGRLPERFPSRVRTLPEDGIGPPGGARAGGPAAHYHNGRGGHRPRRPGLPARLWAVGRCLHRGARARPPGQQLPAQRRRSSASRAGAAVRAALPRRWRRPPPSPPPTPVGSRRPAAPVAELRRTMWEGVGCVRTAPA